MLRRQNDQLCVEWVCVDLNAGMEREQPFFIPLSILGTILLVSITVLIFYAFCTRQCWQSHYVFRLSFSSICSSICPFVWSDVVSTFLIKLTG